jgi:hypothetical protein
MMNKPSGMRDRLRTHPNALFIAVFVTLAAVFIFLTVGGLLIGEFSLTYDEDSHFFYGLRIFNLNSERGSASSEMPLSVVNAIPFVLVQKFIDPGYADIRLGKISTIIISLMLGIICFEWLRRMYGRWVGLLGFGMYVLEPNIIAHSGLMTTDIFAAATVTLTLFLGWQFLQKPAFWRGVLLGLALGLCQVAKISGLFLYPVLLLIALIHSLPRLIISLRQREFLKFWKSLLDIFLYGFLILATSIFVINLGFLFNGTGEVLASHQFQSTIFQVWQHDPLVGKIPVPLPAPYLEALDRMLYIEYSSADFGAVYLLGQRRVLGGFPGYFLVAFLLKVPLPIIAVIAWSLWDRARNLRWKEFISNDMFLLIPILAYTIYFNFFFQAQTGIRYLLVIFPILLIFAARNFRNWSAFSRPLRTACILAGCWLVISVASYFPNYISYFNEIVLNRTTAYHYLADSNLDWGQNKGVLKRFLSQHKDYHYNPQRPVAGTVVVDVNQFVGVLGEPETYDWLRDCCQPAGTFRYTSLIFHVPPGVLPPGK